MGMDLRRLRSFVAVAQLGSLTRAARHLHIEQPPLSRQISSLEKEVGFDLFTRSRTGMRLTELGSVLSRHASRIVEEINILDSIIEISRREYNHKINIGLADGLHNLDRLIKSMMVMRSFDSQVIFGLKHDCNENIIAMLKDGAVDVALIWGEADDDNFTSRIILQEKMFAVIPDKNSKKNSFYQSIYDVDYKHILSPSKYRNKYFGDMMENLFPPESTVKTNLNHDIDLLSLAPMVASGAGCGFVPELLTATSVNGVSYVEVRGDEAICVASLVTRREILPPLVRTFLSSFS
ncbi:DNA-binding transcriptional LysR family regulator [Asaia bogorensis NBRC 16594]|nr:DNA-binding transcriptional LysR family regulator [Asaia bogorensis NBRC 16594]